MSRSYKQFLKIIFYIVSAYKILPYFMKITTGLYDNFYSSSISFDLDTLFVDWNTTFPAVTVCEIYNGEKIWDIAEEYFKTADNNGDHNMQLDDFVGEVVFNRGICTTCEKCAESLQSGSTTRRFSGSSSTTATTVTVSLSFDDYSTAATRTTTPAPTSTETAMNTDNEYDNRTEMFQRYQIDVDKENKRLQCPTNFTELAILFRSSCFQLIKNCVYSDIEFNCCEVFHAIPTEYGLCYSFNSKQSRQAGATTEYVSNRQTGVGHLVFETSSDVQIHIHPPTEVPFLYSEAMIRETVLLGKSKEIILNVMEVYNHVSVSRLSIVERRCRFSHERTAWGEQLDIYAAYSFSTCMIECTLALQLQVCNCASHFLASAAKAKVSICDYRGLSCLTSHLYDLLEARKNCDCMSSCEEPEYDIVFNSGDEDIEENQNVTSIKIALAELPSQRYVRRVTKDFLDLLISVGGLVGLFFNMSFIRVVEYLFLLREFRWRSLWQRITN